MHKLHGFELKWAPSANAPRRPIPGGKWVRNPVFGCLVEELSDWVILEELNTSEVLLNLSEVRNLVSNRLHC